MSNRYAQAMRVRVSASADETSRSCEPEDPAALVAVSDFHRAWLDAVARGATDADLVALAWIYCHEMVYALARRITGSSWEAEDVVQSLFEDLGRRLPTIRDPARLPGFLRKCAIRRAVQIVQRSRWRRERLQAAKPSTDAAQAHSVVAATELRRLLDRLGPDERAAAELKYIDMCSHDEVAQQLGVSVATARRRVEAARKKLAAWWGGRPDLAA